MLTGLRWLALEAKYLDKARSFYEDDLSLPVVSETASEVVYDAGEQHLLVRRPDAVPRGGVHTHFAFSTPDDRYDDWWERLSDSYDLEEFSFGSAKSLYLYDPDGNCVEIGQAGGEGRAITRIFEVVLEVSDLAAAESFYTDLGFEVVDRGEERRRVRLRGPVDLELWEPQLGIADARGGLHVDLGFTVDDVDATLEPVRDRIDQLTELDSGVQGRDPDGHILTFLTE